MTKRATAEDLYADLQQIFGRFAADVVQATPDIFGDILPPGAAASVRDAVREAAARVGQQRPHRVQPARDPRAVLGLGPTAGPREARAVYRRLARRWHPDRPGGDARKMAEVNAAYEALRTRRDP